jgi:hypothetical protein
MDLEGRSQHKRQSQKNNNVKFLTNQIIRDKIEKINPIKKGIKKKKIIDLKRIGTKFDTKRK